MQIQNKPIIDGYNILWGYFRCYSFSLLRSSTRNIKLHLIGRQAIAVVVVVVVRLTIIIDIARIVLVVVVERTLDI